MKAELELYIHIPFCEKKCNYCDFLSFRAGNDVQEAYIAQLIKELTIMAAGCGNYSVSSVFVGGGTPSLLTGESIALIIGTIRKYYDLAEDAEITVECNPGSIIRHKLAAYKKAGVNRLSIGLQSADNAELKMLGRVHSFEEFLKTFQAAKMEGFENINIDLINCFPMQSMKTWRKTLKNVLMFKPEHVSVYNLIIEPGTPFYEMQQGGFLMMPSEDEQAEMDEFTRTYMKHAGYERYEFSNWAKPGYKCRHNVGYWTGVPYIGFGLGASSYYNGFRWKNTPDMEEYLGIGFEKWSDDESGKLRKELKKLSREEKMEEFMYLGLRCTEGISSMNFLGKFGVYLETVYGEQLGKYMGLGLIEQRGDRYALTERGIDLSNVVLSDFLLTK
ncbi:MAG: radical SAM family heme chaperone HemW [Eubacteriales bacterium]|nr:radical SAM family heme chaperone HemW [Eubacteriales bacterium]